MRRIPDAELIQKLQNEEGGELDKVFSYLYRKVYDQVFFFIRKYKGIEADAEDTFHDGLIALLKLARRGSLAANINVEAYLFSICKNLWFKQLKKKKPTINLDEIQLADPIGDLPLHGLMKKEEQEEIQNLMQQLGQNCHKVLIYYYYDRFSMKKISELMGYSSEQGAKNKKLECMRKLKKLFFKN